MFSMAHAPVRLAGVESVGHPRASGAPNDKPSHHVSSESWLAEMHARFAVTVRAYSDGQPRLGLEAASEGIELARANGDLVWQRKMLTIQGILQSDLHNLPSTVESFEAALDICDQIADPIATWSVWNNLTGAFASFELPEAALQAGEIAVGYAARVPTYSDRQKFRAYSLANVAYACLFSNDYARGLRAAREANELFEVEMPVIDGTALEAEVLARVSALCTHTRLCLRVGLVEKATECVSRTRQLAAGFKTNFRVQWIARLAKGMALARCGRFEYGKDEITQCLQAVRGQNSELFADALRALIESHQTACRFEAADVYVGELALHMQSVRSDETLFHHRRHVKGLVSSQRRSALSLLSNCESASSQARKVRKRDDRADREAVLEDLCAAAELHDDPSGKHPFRVGELAACLARRIAMPEPYCRDIALAARLHDVGKVGIPSEILRKPGPLSISEADIMRTHTSAGADLLASAGGKRASLAATIARHHHEWWSGSGYPSGYSGEQIPLAARIVALAEAFDAMTHDRPYRPRLSIERAVSLIVERAGHQFDPELSERFCELIRDLRARHADLDRHLEKSCAESRFFEARQRLNARIGATS